MSRVKHGAGRLLATEEKFDRSYGLSLFGDAVSTEQQEMVLRIVGLFEKSASYPSEHKKRIRSHVASEKLNPLLEKEFANLPKNHPFDLFKSAVTRGVLDALARLDPQPFRDFASAIEAAQRVRSHGPVHPLQTMIHRLAERLAVKRGENEPLACKELRMTSKKFTDELNKEFNTNHSEPHVRKAGTVLGYQFSDGTKGRPKKSKP